MKKILLSCVTCLLALGLVTACDNEDEVVEKDDGLASDTETSDSDTGTGGDTTGDVTSLSNYTLSFTLTGEEIPDYATLYITGDWNEWSFEALEAGEGVYTYTFDTITIDWHNFKLVMWYTDETVSWEGDNYVEVVNEPWIDENGQTQYGNAYFEVTASQGDGYTLDLEYEVSATLEKKVITVASITLSPTSISFAYEDIAAQTTQTITASVIGSDGSAMEDEEVSWSSDTETVATVVSGVVTPVGSGSATITVTSITDEAVSATCSVYVGAVSEVLVDSVVIDQSELTLTMDESSEGHSATVKATVSGAEGATPTNPEVSWSQTGDVIEIGTPTQTELVSEVTVTALNAGSGTLTATAGGVTVSIPVTVEPIEGDGTIVFTVYFVDNATTIGNYYSIPDYSSEEVEDTYKSVQGFLGYEYDGVGNSWVGPSDKASDDPMELVANGSAEEGYSVSVSGLNEGKLKTYVYFAFSALLGDNTDIWNHQHAGSDVTITSTLASVGGEVEVYVEANPSELIYPPSDDDYINVTVGLFDTGSGSHNDAMHIKGGTGTWVDGSFSTYSGQYSEKIHESYTYENINKTTDKLEFEISKGSSETWGTSLGAVNGSLTGDSNLCYLYCYTGGPTWGIDFGSISNGELSGVTGVVIIFSFDFSSFTTSSYNILTSNDITVILEK